MQAEAVLRYLTKPDVTEVALQSGRLPCVVMNGTFKPLSQDPLSIDEINGVLGQLGGRTQLARLTVEPAKWDFDHATLGRINISAKYVGDVLQARLRIAQQPARPKQPSKPPAPRKSQRPARPSRPPSGTLAAPDVAVPRAARSPRAEVVLPDSGIEMPSLDDLVIAAPAGRPQPAPQPPPPPPPPPPAPPPPPIVAAQPQPAAARAHVQAAGEVRGGRGTDHLDVLFAQAREMRASDLHVIAERPPLFRVVGELVARGDVLPADIVEQLVLPRVPERVRPDLDQHGSCDFSLEHPTAGRFRANVSRHRQGYKLSVRPIPDRVMTLAELGLPESIARATQHHQGLIVVTGPTGHGKTTTMSAIVDAANRELFHHIITVEDPIEFVHARRRAMISQREVGSHTRTFASALKGSLREDPDIIVIGETRDAETVRMALQAAETGHLVLTTMNTPSASKAIERLIDLFPPADQPQVRITLASALRLIVAQRLVPTKDKRALVAAAEILPGIPALWNLIRDNRTFQIPSLQQRGKMLGIVRLEDSLAELVKSGRVDLAVAREYAESAEDLDAIVSGKNKPADPAQAKDKTMVGLGGAAGFAGKLFGGPGGDRKG